MRGFLLVSSLVVLCVGCNERKGQVAPDLALVQVLTPPDLAAPRAPEVVRDWVLIITTPEPAALAGRSIELQPVKVQKVVSDRVFTIGDSTGRMAYAMLDASLDAGAAEKKIVVKEGQTVELSGIIERAQGEDIAAARARGLTEKEAEAMKAQKLYLLAKKIRFNP